MKRGKVMNVLVFGFIWMGFLGCTSRMAGNIQMKQGDYPSAIQNYQKVVSENPDDWQAKEQLGIAFYKNGQNQEAISALNAVLKRNPDASEAKYYLGLAQLKTGRREQAIQNWEEYKNPEAPIVQSQVKKQLTLLKINDSLQFAKEALAKEEALQTQPPKPNSVAVFYFQDLSPDNQFKYLQKAIASMIITDLSQVRTLHVIERLRVQYLLEEMELGSTGIVDKSTAPRTGRLLGAEHLVVGTLDSGSIVNQTGIASTQKKDVIASFNLKEEQGQFFELQKKIVTNILQVLNARVTPSEKRSISRYHTKNLKAATYYGRGLDAQDKGQWKNAKQYYRKAMEEDPTFYLAFWQNDACPGESAPSIGQLSSMSSSDIGNSAEENIQVARSRQSRADARSRQQAQKSLGDAGGGEQDAHAGKESGNISVSW